MHCKRDHSYLVWNTLLWKLLWSALHRNLVASTFQGITRLLDTWNLWKHFMETFDEFFWQGASCEVIVSRNLIDFTLWCPSYQSDGVGFLLKAVCGDFKIKVSMKCLAWGHCAQKFDEVVSFYRDPSECSIWGFLLKSFVKTFLWRHLTKPLNVL